MGSLRSKLQVVLIAVSSLSLLFIFCICYLLGDSLSQLQLLGWSHPLPVFTPIDYVSTRGLQTGKHSTTDFAVYLSDEVDNEDDVIKLATSLNMGYRGRVGTLANYHLFTAPHNHDNDKTQQALYNHPHIAWFEQQTVRWRYHRADGSIPVRVADDDVPTTQNTTVNTTTTTDKPPPTNTPATTNINTNTNTHTNTNTDTNTKTDTNTNTETDTNANADTTNTTADTTTPTTTPTTTYTNFKPKDPLFHTQWHLVNSGQSKGTPKEDMNILGAWELSRGRGFTVAVVDDGVLPTHPDLEHRYNAKGSHNFNADGDPNIPQPVPGDAHGTMCAGAAAASTNNVCGIGVAFEASVSGLRILGGPASDAMEASALTYNYNVNDIYSSSWGPFDDGRTLEGPGPLTKAALVDGITKGRDGKGSIYVWAAGNGAKYGDNCNYDGYASSRYVLTVGGVNHLGMHAYFSELCAAMIISAPSSIKDQTGITTTDLGNECTSEFAGTSAAAPLVAGVIALMLETNANLTWRDVHHIMVKTARRNDVHDSDWVKNGAGLYVNHRYGFGVVDAHAAVVAAQTWTQVEPEVTFSSPVIEVYKPIADNSHKPVTSSYYIGTDIIVENAEVVFTSFHSYRADLRVVLTSPAGTESVLATVHGKTSSYSLQMISSATGGVPKIVSVVPGVFSALPAEWEPQNVTARVVAAIPLDGCTPLENKEDLTGVLVLIQRGACGFVQKVKNVQDRGAAAMLVTPSSAGEKPVEMDGVDSGIIIPALMMSGKDGQNLLSQLAAGDKVVGVLAAIIPKQKGLTPYNDWTFTTVRCWNESSLGDWTLSVSDLSEGGVGTFDRWQLQLYGTKGAAWSPNPIMPSTRHIHVPRHGHLSPTKLAMFALIIIFITLFGAIMATWAFSKEDKPYYASPTSPPLESILLSSPAPPPGR